MPDHGGNWSYDHWNASLVSNVLHGQVDSSVWYFETGCGLRVRAPLTNRFRPLIANLFLIEKGIYFEFLITKKKGRKQTFPQRGGKRGLKQLQTEQVCNWRTKSFVNPGCIPCSKSRRSSVWDCVTSWRSGVLLPWHGGATLFCFTRRKCWHNSVIYNYYKINDFIFAMKIIVKATLRIQSFTLKLHYRNL